MRKVYTEIKRNIKGVDIKISIYLKSQIQKIKNTQVKIIKYYNYPLEHHQDKDKSRLVSKAKFRNQRCSIKDNKAS